MYKAQNEKEASNTVRNDQPEEMSKKAEETGYNNDCEGQVSDRRQSVHHLPDFQKSGRTTVNLRFRTLMLVMKGAEM